MSSRESLSQDPAPLMLADILRAQLVQGPDIDFVTLLNMSNFLSMPEASWPTNLAHELRAIKDKTAAFLEGKKSDIPTP